MNPYFDRVARIVADACAIQTETIRADCPLAAYGLDSVNVVDLILRIEETFGIQVSASSVERLRTVGDAAAYVQEQVEC
jgi:acyl carrier protein